MKKQLFNLFLLMLIFVNPLSAVRGNSAKAGGKGAKSSKKKQASATKKKRHMRTHTGKKPFECDRCNKEFARKHDLKIHMRTHTGERPFVCDICGYRFTQKGNLMRHILSHTSEKLFECKVCCSRFKKRSNLVDHEKTKKHKKALTELANLPVVIDGQATSETQEDYDVDLISAGITDEAAAAIVLPLDDDRLDVGAILDRAAEGLSARRAEEDFFLQKEIFDENFALPLSDEEQLAIFGYGHLLQQNRL